MELALKLILSNHHLNSSIKMGTYLIDLPQTFGGFCGLKFCEISLP